MIRKMQHKPKSFGASKFRGKSNRTIVEDAVVIIIGWSSQESLSRSVTLLKGRDTLAPA
jgi:hypothetical protein